jgi:hypothetical protein
MAVGMFSNLSGCARLSSKYPTAAVINTNSIMMNDEAMSTGISRLMTMNMVPVDLLYRLSFSKRVSLTIRKKRKSIN